MPDLWTHIIGGDMVINDLDDRAVCDLILEYRKYFNMGTQGPDFFFYNDFWPWIKDKKGPLIGRMIHNEKKSEFIVSIFDILKENEGAIQYPQALAYFIGFITHLVLDEKVHKIIDVSIDNDKDHKRFELELDCILVEKYYNEKCYKLNPVNYIKIGNKIDDLIKDIYYLNITRLYEKNINIELIDQSYQDMLKVHNILYSPFKVKATLFKLLNNFLSLDLNQYLYANVNRYYVLSSRDLDEIENIFPEFISISKDLIKEISLYLKGDKKREDLKELINSYINLSF